MPNLVLKVNKHEAVCSPVVSLFFFVPHIKIIEKFCCSSTFSALLYFSMQLLELFLCTDSVLFWDLNSVPSISSLNANLAHFSMISTFNIYKI